MSIKPWEKYQPNAQIPTPQYPWGSLKNESNLGVGDGTPLDVDWGNDFEAFKQTAFDRSGLVPSGVADTVENSEMFNAMQDIVLRNIWERLVLETGYTLATGSFEEGSTLNSNTECLWYKTENKVFNWTGTIPSGGKIVPPSSNPTGTGGISPSGNWAPIGNDSLRSDLAGIDGASLVGSATYAQIRAYTGGATVINCLGRANVFDRAQGVFVRDATDTTSPDNDGTVLIDAGGRRWIRQLAGVSAPEWFGAKGDGVTNDSVAMTAALNLGMSVKCLSPTYRLTSQVNLIEPFDFDGNNAEFIIDHAGDGFYVKSSVYANKTNICSLLNINFTHGTITPNSHITVGEATVLEPTNIQLNGIHFRGTYAGQAHVVNKRSYGLKINNSAFNEVIGTCVLFESGVGGDETRYSYNCYLEQVDITGCTNGVIVEGGKISISNSVIESCTGKAVWSKGISFNPSIYMDNIYFENNVYSLYFESQQPQGYTRNSEVRNSFFASNSGLNHASDNNDIRLSNNKGFTFDRVTGSGNWSLAGTQFPIPYNAITCPAARIRFESPVRTEYDVIPANIRNILPYFNLKRISTGRVGAAMKVTIVRQSGIYATYYQAILMPTDPAGTTWREVVIASSSVGGIVANPTYERSGDPLNMNLYFYFPQSAITIVIVEGDGGVC